jgi:hypothetical protein
MIRGDLSERLIYFTNGDSADFRINNTVGLRGRIRVPLGCYESFRRAVS